MSNSTPTAAAALCVLLQCCLAVTAAATAAAGSLHPVILFPGFISSMLEARLTPAYQPGSPECAAHIGAGWFRLWRNITAMSEPGSAACFGEQSSLHYDPVADDYRNTAGVETRVPFFGSTKGILYTDPDHKEETVVMAKLVARLEAAGYRDGDTLFGVPYDFRYGFAAPGNPDAAGDALLHRLKRLVEDAVDRCGGKKVVIVSHSLGTFYAHQFVVRSDMSWRHRYVKRLVFLAGTVSGTGPASMPNMASGSNQIAPSTDPLTLRQVLRSYTTLLWAQPTVALYGNRTLVITPEKNYSAGDLYQFFADIGAADAIEPYKKRILPMVKEITPPYVPVTIMVGTGIPTPELFTYTKGFDTAPEVVAFGDGDGSANGIGIDAMVSAWATLPGQATKVIKLKNVTHGGIISDDSALDRVMEQIMEERLVFFDR